MSILSALPAVHALEQRGLDTDRVLAVARLSRDSLSSFDYRIPHKNVRALWEEAAKASRDPSFGIHVAEALPLGRYDLFDYLLMTAATIGEGLVRVTDHSRILHDHCNLRVIVEPRGARMVASLRTTAPQFDEFILTLLIIRTRQASGSNWVPDGVSLQHERADDGELTRVLGCPVSFGGGQTEIRFRRSVLQLPSCGADAALAAILVRHATMLESSLPRNGTLVARASSAIAQRMARELPSLAATAKALDLPKRTLQRQLSGLGVTHSQLVDEVRRALALKHIGDAGIAITEIAYLLHFADPSAFYRAFKRWTGQSPRGYRNRLYDAPGSRTVR